MTVTYTCNSRPTGSCCYADGSCAATLATGCTGAWTIFGDGSVPCPQPPTGVCCDPAIDICTMTTQAACVGQRTIGGTCTPNLCPVPVPIQERIQDETRNIYS